MASALASCGGSADDASGAPPLTSAPLADAVTVARASTAPAATARAIVPVEEVRAEAGGRVVEGLELAPGFDAVVISRSSGTVPPAFDGMAAFATPGGVRLVRNHERRLGIGGAVPLDGATAYDPSGPGGASTLVLGPDGRTLEREFISLSGTVANCSGGATPWGSWLSCEESTEGVDQGFERAHGYVYEVPADVDQAVGGQPLRHLGRLMHEAIAVDPATGVLYLTEDNGYDSGLYRFVPDAPGSAAGPGRLEMLAVVGLPEYDTAFGQPAGVRLPCAWVAIDEPDPAGADVDTSLVFNQGLALGGARFKRLEGCALRERTLFVSSTEGGDAGLGQVWALDVDRDEIALVVEAGDPAVLFAPDNLAELPGGGALVVCEDNAERNRLLVMDAAGAVTVLAENVGDDTELTGICVAPDGSTLYVNVFGDVELGIAARTFAIWGPWESVRG